MKQKTFRLDQQVTGKLERNLTHVCVMCYTMTVQTVQTVQTLQIINRVVEISVQIQRTADRRLQFIIYHR